MKRILFVVALAMISATTLFGQSKLSNYTALMLDSRKSMTVDQFKKTPMGQTLRSVNGKETVDCYVHFVKAIDKSVLEQYGATLHCAYENVNIATAAVPVDMIEALAADSRVKMVEAGVPLRKHLDNARPASHATEVLDGVAPLTKSYLGRGVVVGVVDNDFQYDHPAFWNSDHNRFRVKRAWIQNNVTGTPPSQFSYGTELADSASILNKQYDTKQMESGHGTHVSGIATGADHSLGYYGIAQEADIVMVTADSYGTVTSTSIPDGVKYCLDYASSIGKPCVVNVSMGSAVGPRDGSSTESVIINGLVGRGRIVCGSAGNSGSSDIHAGKTLSAEDSTFITFISFVGSDKKAYIDAYGDTGQTYKLEVVAYNKASKSCSYVSVPITKTTEGTINFRVDTVLDTYGRIKIGGKMYVSTTSQNRQHVTIQLTSVDSIANRHDIGIRITSTEPGLVNLWSYEDYSTFTNSNQKQILDGDTHYTVDDPMGVTDGVIAVGSYTTYAQYPSIQKVNQMSYFSSEGPTADGRVKPDITAPGEVLVSAFPDLTRLKSERAFSTTVGGNTYYYAYMQGTSMSSPYCAGTIATWLEADSTLDYDRIIDVFNHTTMRDQYTTYDIPNTEWGYGKLNAYAGLLYVLGLSEQVQDVTTTGVLAAYPNPTSDILNIGFPAEDNNVRVAIYDLSGKCVYTNTLTTVSAGENLEINVSSLTNGAYVVRVNGDKIADTIKLMKE